MQNARSVIKAFSRLLAFLLLLELIAGYIYYQRSWDKGLAINWVINRVRNQFDDRYLPQQTLYSSLPKKTYASHLHHWLSDVRASGISTVLLYIPTYENKGLSNKNFFQGLAQTEGIPFVDVSEQLQSYDKHWIYNLPKDDHLSRLGHQLVASCLQQWLLSTPSFLSSGKARQTVFGNIKGPHPSFVDQVRMYQGRAYRVETNNYGFRMTHPIGHMVTGSILIIGDSFTFGTGVDTEEAFPNALEKLLNGNLVVNAGQPGAGLLEEIATYYGVVQGLKPLVVVLQVHDNDIE